MKRLTLIAVALTLLMARGRADDEISVLQFNIWQEGTVVPGGFGAIADEIARLAPDFVTLSEVRNYDGSRFCDRIVNALAERGLTYHSFYSDDTGLLSAHALIDTATVFPLADDHGSIYRLNAMVGDDLMAVYTAHLDYLDDTYYEVRGYDGRTWQRRDGPLTDVAEILRRNALSRREAAVDSFLVDAREQLARGATVIIGGDFNEPSALDWTAVTADSADHHGVVVEWPCSVKLSQGGFTDAYRAVFPSPVTHPGYTYPADNPSVAVGRLTWAPLADERERIDYVMVDSASAYKPVDAAIIGPEGCVVRSERVRSSSADRIIPPAGVWPSDHKAVWVLLRKKSDDGVGK